MRGVLFDFMLGIIVIGFLMMLYIAVDYAYDTSLYPHAQTYITDSDAQNSLALINVIWTYFPLVILLAFLIYGITRAQRREE